MSEQHGQQVIHCPNCGSNKVQALPVVLVLILSAGCMMWIPVIGWIIAPILLLGAAFTGLIKGRGMRCMECKQGFRVEKETYKEYKAQLRSK